MIKNRLSIYFKYTFSNYNLILKKIAILVLLVTASAAIGQNSNRKYISHNINNNQLTVQVSDGTYQISFKNECISETTFVPNGQTFNQQSHSVILNNNSTFTTIETKEALQISSKQFAVMVNYSPFQIMYLKNNKDFLSEKLGYIKANDSTEIINFAISKNEKLYGGGARALGMNRRGNRLKLYNKASYGYETKAPLMNFCVPLVLSSNLYAIHFDNAAIGYLDLDSKNNNTLDYETISGRKTYQVIIGKSWPELISNYTNLTGKQPLPPRWALGNFASRFGYHSQEEVEKTIRKFEEDKIPVDAIILDLFWFGKTIKGTMGNLDWDADNFPNPTKMIADLQTKGVKTILITEPFILQSASKWQEAADKQLLATDKNNKPITFDFYFGTTGIIDLFKPDGKAWFWTHYKKLINQGVAGIWGDLGEPEVLPSAAITAGGKADEIHNIYGHNWAKLLAEGYQNDYPKQRPFILMRSGYSGSQRFGMIPWSGDVARSWGGLQSQAEIALQMGMQGFGYMHSDLGGFAGDYFDNELYIRWLQYGVFQPVFRPHAQEEVASEAVYKDIITKDKAKKQIELRYQMLPYNYSLAFENNQKGIPLMRPLFFEEPTNQKVLSMSDTYLWGNNFLVHPITSAGATEALLYFPKNNNWYDFYTDKKYLAGTTQKIPTSAAYIPTFIRGGSLIPLVAPQKNTLNYSLNNFDLHFYFDPKTATSTATLYNDDGLTPTAFENESYELLKFKATVTSKSILIKWNTVVGKNYTTSKKTMHLIIHNTTKPPKKVVVTNQQNTVYSFNKKRLTIKLTATDTITKEIKIKY